VAAEERAGRRSATEDAGEETVLKLTNASAHAVRALVHMASNGDLVLASHNIVAAEGVPERYLLKVLHPLAVARLALSSKGPGGGYHLARPANRITLLDIVEAVDGPLLGEAPDVGGGKQLRELLQQVCDRAAESVRQQLRKVTAQDLVGRKG
jgi:Rrf2 family protein